MSLTYVTLRTDDGVLKIPNSAMLAAGVGHPSPNAIPPSPGSAGPPSLGTAGPPSPATPGATGSTTTLAVPTSVAQGGAPSGGQPGI